MSEQSDLLDLLMLGQEVGLSAIGTIGEVLQELIPEDRPDLYVKMTNMLNMASDVLKQGP